MMEKKGRVSADLLKKIKEQVNLIDVVGEHVVLRKTGSNAVGLCPFHSERSPSFSVSENKQLYHCYGCKRGGDLVTFVMEILGIGFPEALEELADRARIALPKDWSGGSENPENEKARSAQREKLALAYKLNRFAAAFYHHTLVQHSLAQQYFQKRGIGDDWVKTFYLGSVTGSWDTLARHFQSKKAPLSLAVELGLIRPSVRGRVEQGSGYFDLFRNRVLFPILNLRGKVAGFGGRVLGEDSPKYLNSPESFIFQKGRLAYGLYQAQKHIREKDELILVEGYFDVLAMHAAGFQNVVATCGTSLTLDHLSQFKKFASKVTVLFDGDKAGVMATERAMETALDAGWVIFGAKMPEGMDPDEIILNAGKDRMTEILQGSQSILDSRIADLLHSSQSDNESRAQALKKIGNWLTRLQDPIGREVRVDQIQKKWGISRQLLQPQSLPGRPSEVKRAPLPKAGISPSDRILLAGIAGVGKYADLFFEAGDSLPPGVELCDLFDYPPARTFMASLIEKPERVNLLRTQPELLLQPDLDTLLRSQLTEALLAVEPPFSKETFKGALNRSLARNWARFSQRIKAALTEAEVRKDSGLQAQLMKEYLDVQRKMKDFSNFYDEE